MPRPFKLLPAYPFPIQWDVDGRIGELQTMIDDPITSEDQKVNLRVAIAFYREGALPGPARFIQYGRVVKLEDVDLKRAWWSEGHAEQF